MTHTECIEAKAYMLEDLFKASDEEILKSHTMADLKDIYRQVYDMEPASCYCSTKRKILRTIKDYLDGIRYTKALFSRYSLI